MKAIIITFAPGDRETATFLARDLEQQGVRARLRPDDPVQAAQVLADAAALVAVTSPVTRGSPTVLADADVATRAGVPVHAVRLGEAAIEGLGSVASTTDAFGADAQANVNRLAAALRLIQDAGSAPPSVDGYPPAGGYGGPSLDKPSVAPFPPAAPVPPIPAGPPASPFPPAPSAPFGQGFPPDPGFGPPPFPPEGPRQKPLFLKILPFGCGCFALLFIAILVGIFLIWPRSSYSSSSYTPSSAPSSGRSSSSTSPVGRWCTSGGTLDLRSDGTFTDTDTASGRVTSGRWLDAGAGRMTLTFFNGAQAGRSGAISYVRVGAAIRLTDNRGTYTANPC